MKMTSKMRTTSKIKMTSKAKTTSQNEDDLKIENHLKNEDDLKIVNDHTALPFSAFALISFCIWNLKIWSTPYFAI